MGLQLAQMTTNLINLINNNPIGLKLTENIIIMAYAGTGFTTLLYIYFFYVCVHASVVYCKAPKNLAVYTNISAAAVS